jgi:hypothetical protein
MPILWMYLLAVLFLQGCLGAGPGAFRDPSFRPAQIRRPAIALTVSLDRTGLFGEGEFSARERASIPEAYETALLEGLNSEGILLADISVTADRSSRGSREPLEGIDRGQALSRGRSVDADHVVIIAVRLHRGELVHCREANRPFVAPTTVIQAALELLRVRDGARLLLEPRGPALEATDVEPDCERRRVTRRASGQELVEESVGKVLKRLLKR